MISAFERRHCLLGEMVKRNTNDCLPSLGQGKQSFSALTHSQLHCLSPIPAERPYSLAPLTASTFALHKNKAHSSPSAHEAPNPTALTRFPWSTKTGHLVLHSTRDIGGSGWQGLRVHLRFSTLLPLVFHRRTDFQKPIPSPNTRNAVEEEVGVGYSRRSYR